MTNNDQTPAIRQDVIDYVIAPANDGMTEAESIAANPQYSQPYKQQRIKERLETATADLNWRLDSKQSALEKEQAQLSRAARLSVVPTADQAVALAYARDALQIRWATMKTTDIVQDWTAAIENEDSAAARIYRDFAAPFLSTKLNETSQAHVLPQYYKLAAQTDDLLSTPEQKKARGELATVEATLRSLTLAVGQARIRIDPAKVRIGNGGQVIDGQRATVGTTFRL